MDTSTLIGTIAGLAVGFLLSILVISVFQARTGGVKSITWTKGVEFFPRIPDHKSNPDLFLAGIYLERVEAAIREDNGFLYSDALKDSSHVLASLGFSDPKVEVDKLLKGIGAGASPIRHGDKYKTHILGILRGVKEYVTGAIKESTV